MKKQLRKRVIGKKNKMKSSNSILEKIGNGIFNATQIGLFAGGIGALAYYTGNIEEITKVEASNVFGHIYYGVIVPSTFFVSTFIAPISNKHYSQGFIDFLRDKKE